MNFANFIANFQKPIHAKLVTILDLREKYSQNKLNFQKQAEKGAKLKRKTKRVSNKSNNLTNKSI